MNNRAKRGVEDVTEDEADKLMSDNILTAKQVAAICTERDELRAANRALQAEVERLRRVVERKDAALSSAENFVLSRAMILASADSPNLVESNLYSKIKSAIAYTGTEPRQGGHT